MCAGAAGGRGWAGGVDDGVHGDSGGMDGDPSQDWESGGAAGGGAHMGGEMLCLMDRRDTSNVPPLRSYTMIWLSLPFLSRPYTIATAVGSLMMQRTCRPAMMPAMIHLDQG